MQSQLTLTENNGQMSKNKFHLQTKTTSRVSEKKEREISNTKKCISG